MSLPVLYGRNRSITERNRLHVSTQRQKEVQEGDDELESVRDEVSLCYCICYCYCYLF